MAIDDLFVSSSQMLRWVVSRRLANSRWVSLESKRACWSMCPSD